MYFHLHFTVLPSTADFQINFESTIVPYGQMECVELGPAWKPIVAGLIEPASKLCLARFIVAPCIDDKPLRKER